MARFLVSLTVTSVYHVIVAADSEAEAEYEAIRLGGYDPDTKKRTGRLRLENLILVHDQVTEVERPEPIND